MRLNLGEVLIIEDLGKHSAATVISLALHLAGAADVTADPKRKGFYEVDDGRTVYYIHVSPVTATIFLLATWENLPSSQAELRMASAARSACLLLGLSAEATASA